MMTKYFSVLFVFIRTVSSLLFHWVMWVISPVLTDPKPHPLQKVAGLSKLDHIIILMVLRKQSISVIIILLHTLDSCELHLKMRESAINLVLLRKNQVNIRVNSDNIKILPFYHLVIKQPGKTSRIGSQILINEGSKGNQTLYIINQGAEWDNKPASLGSRSIHRLSRGLLHPPPSGPNPQGQEGCYQSLARITKGGK